MSSPDYINLGRRFVNFDARDITTLTMRMLGSHADRVTLGWEDLTRSRCVVILGEPGCGKTTETKARVAAQRARGGHAFYRTVSDLCRAGGPLVPLPERERLGLWKASDEEALFVLDSMDEARNVGGTLHEAIDRLAVELEPQWNRLQVVLTCRVADWREEDGAVLAHYFPSPKPLQIVEPEPSRSPPTSWPSAWRSQRATTDTAETPPAVRVVRLAVLSDNQALTLARELGAKRPDQLQKEVQRTGAWALLERPADVTWLVRSWNKRGTIGTLTQLMEDNVCARLEEHGTSRRRVSTLSTELAARAAREFALCATLTGEPRLQVLGPTAGGGGNDGLDPAMALPWMSPKELAEFLDRALFVDDGPTLRRVHHRATQEYLAAQALQECLGNQPGGSALADFLVRESHGRRVVPPSLRGVAGWAAGWNAPLRRALLAADPLVLLESGDPEAIPVGERRGALARILDELKARPWRREHADHADLARFACPELSELVRAGLVRGDKGEPGRQLLLRLVWHGRLAENAEDALRLAQGKKVTDDERGLALRAAAAAGDASIRARIVKGVCGGNRTWIESLFDVAYELYPDAMTPSDLGTGLIAWARAGQRTDHSETSHPSWLLDSKYAPESHDVLLAMVGPELFRRAQTIRTRREDPGPVAVRLAMILQALLERRLRDDTPLRALADAWAPWLWAFARVYEAVASHDSQLNSVGDLLKAMEVRRATIRWLVQHRVPLGTQNLGRPLNVFRNEPYDLWTFHDDDFHWVLEELRATQSEKERLVWFGIAYQAAGPDKAAMVDSAGAVFPELAKELAQRQQWRQAPPHPHEEELRVQWNAMEAERQARELQNREAIVAAIDAIREGTHERALRYLTERMGKEVRHRWGQSDWMSLAEPFGEAVAKATRAGLKLAWRRYLPLLPHQRARQNEVEWFVPVGLTGLNIAFADGLSVHELTDGDVERATAYALSELNGFPTWLGDLAEARPDAVLRILSQALAAEYVGADAASRRAVMENLERCDLRIRSLATPTILQLLGDQSTDEGAIGTALAAVDTSDVNNATMLLALARDRASLDGDAVGAAWWQYLARLDTKSATAILIDATSRSAPHDTLMAAISNIDWTRSGLSATELCAVVRVAYGAIAPDEDIQRPNDITYSPGARDDAQERRAGLVGHLAAIPGRATFNALLELAADPLVVAHRDWFTRLAHERAQRDSEKPPLELRAAREFAIRPDAHFADADEFFGFALARLDDVRRAVETGDFSCRELLRPSDEAGVQRFLAYALHLATTGRCSVVREEEVDALKKPDLRLHATHPPAVIGIEVKIADSWTTKELDAALERQLVGQYLRDARSRHGVLLLVHTGDKRHWGKGKAGITFETLVARLRDKAKHLSLTSEVRVNVVAINCTLATAVR